MASNDGQVPRYGEATGLAKDLEKKLADLQVRLLRADDVLLE